MDGLLAGMDSSVPAFHIKQQPPAVIDRLAGVVAALDSPIKVTVKFCNT